MNPCPGPNPPSRVALSVKKDPVRPCHCRRRRQQAPPPPPAADSACGAASRQRAGNMSLRRRLLSLLRDARLAPAGRLAGAPSSRSFSLPPAATGAASTSGGYFTVSVFSAHVVSSYPSEDPLAALLGSSMIRSSFFFPLSRLHDIVLVLMVYCYCESSSNLKSALNF